MKGETKKATAEDALAGMIISPHVLANLTTRINELEMRLASIDDRFARLLHIEIPTLEDVECEIRQAEKLTDGHIKQWAKIREQMRADLDAYKRGVEFIMREMTSDEIEDIIKIALIIRGQRD